MTCPLTPPKIKHQVSQKILAVPPLPTPFLCFVFIPAACSSQKNQTMSKLGACSNTVGGTSPKYLQSLENCAKNVHKLKKDMIHALWTKTLDYYYKIIKLSRYVAQSSVLNTVFAIIICVLCHPNACAWVTYWQRAISGLRRDFHRNIYLKRPKKAE